MYAFAHAEDIEDVFRPLTDPERVIAQGLLEQASNKLRARVPTIDQLVDLDELKAALARDAVVNAVKRVLMNPEAVTQSESRSGVFIESRRYDASVASALLALDPGDLVGLLPYKGKFRSVKVKSGLHGDSQFPGESNDSVWSRRRNGR